MGKGRNKNKEKESYTGCTRKGRVREESDSEESISSHITFDDDMGSVLGDVTEDIDSPDFLNVLAEHIENASHKKHFLEFSSISIRLAALRHLQIVLCSQCIPDLVSKWKLTLIDIIVKNLKRGDEEVAISALLLALVSLQIGEDISPEMEDPLAILRTIITDQSKSEQVRSLCALSIAISCHIASINEESISACIKVLRSAWASTKLNAQETKLFTSSLAGWTLLLQDADVVVQNIAFNEFSKLTSFLEADQLDIRIATGEALAFLYEIGSINRPGFRLSNHQQIVELLSSLCSDSSKGKTKKNKRVQRFTFRQIYSTIVDRNTPSMTIKFNRESLVLDSCYSKLLYDVFCEMAAHDAASKHRNRIRGKQRDKRNVVI
ncbi:hypothetical protein DICVIV_01044 [Dictyocaulus viviparus]|uniref:Interferon-related developmental regulator N-terminal domain-containing protein n=1 Tax=Dictyocaulus viviparus TaxID=29172 RepID=A0A0D8Y9G6_DICVI|nr:hypothetical protein DICVIV_01044 [Dictyocaulus viviparus]